MLPLLGLLLVLPLAVLARSSIVLVLATLAALVVSIVPWRAITR